MSRQLRSDSSARFPAVSDRCGKISRILLMLGGAVLLAGFSMPTKAQEVQAADAVRQPEAAEPDWMDTLIGDSDAVPHVDAPGTAPHDHPGMTPEELAEHEHPGMSPEELTEHEHGHGVMATPDRWFVGTLMGVTLAFSGLLFFLGRRALRPAKRTETLIGRDVLKIPLIGRFVRWRHFNTLLLVPTLLIFGFIVVVGLFGQQDTSNPAILLTWILWWPAVIFTFFLVGRIWCTICPFGYMGDVAQKLGTLGKKAPRILKNMWWRLALFLALTWMTTLFALDKAPRGTAYLALALTSGAVVLAVLYEKRVFCRYVCPVGGVFGLYSMTAPVHLSVKDQHICQTECKDKDCHVPCNWFQFPAAMDRGAECNLCLDCVRACPHDNMALNTRPIAGELAVFQPRRKSLDEATTVAAILGVSLLQTVVMLNAWQGWQARLGEIVGIPPGPVLYTLVYLGFGVVLPLILLGFISFLGTRGAAKRPDVFSALRTYAYAFLPLGLGLHAAHNFHHLFGEGGALWQGLKVSFAHYTGWGVEAVANMTPPTPMNANTLYLLQWLALIGALYLAYRVSIRLVARYSSESVRAFRMALPVLLFAVAYTVMNVLILAAPMAHRH